MYGVSSSYIVQYASLTCMFINYVSHKSLGIIVLNLKLLIKLLFGIYMYNFYSNVHCSISDLNGCTIRHEQKWIFISCNREDHIDIV